jgi:hypothetical protein
MEDHSMMQTLHRGFDGLDVSFQAQIGDQLCRALLIAKEMAQEHHKEAVVDFNGVRLAVSESGARGGYAFIASTGPFGATWFFKKPNPRDPWGVRVSCGSFNLAVNGLGGARAELYRTLATLGITVAEQGESIGRVDYAIDILAPEFSLDPQHFVMHSRTGRSDHIEIENIATHGHSGRVTSVTIGKMPGRQVIVYDKRAEVIAKHKVGWWEIWNAKRERMNQRPLIRENAMDSQIWRVELRAGKNLLKEFWKVRHWSDLDNRFGDIIHGTLADVRHAVPSRDSNRSRWPNSALWDHVSAEAKSDLFEMQIFAGADRIKQVQIEEHDRLLAAQITGLFVTRAALQGLQIDDLSNFVVMKARAIANEIKSERSKFERKLDRSRGRYSLGSEPN